MTTTNKPKPQGGVSEDVFSPGMAALGISDITARVDASQTPVNAANDAFGACMIRVAMLEGQLAAEKYRLCELAAQLKQAIDEALEEACRG